MVGFQSMTSIYSGVYVTNFLVFSQSNITFFNAVTILSSVWVFVQQYAFFWCDKNSGGLGKTFKAFSVSPLLAGEWIADVENWAPDVEEVVVGPLEQKPKNLTHDYKEKDRPG